MSKRLNSAPQVLIFFKHKHLITLFPQDNRTQHAGKTRYGNYNIENVFAEVFIHIKKYAIAFETPNNQYMVCIASLKL